MDHLPLPRQTTEIPDRVRYLCSDSPYDGGDFSTYPIRVGWPELLRSHSGVPYWSSCQTQTIDEELMKKHERLLQSWIFFGLLHKVLSPFDLYNAEDYIEEVDGVKWLHSKQLGATIARWHERLEAYNEAQRSVLVEDARECFILPREVLLALQQEVYKPFDRMVNASLMAICTAVEGMILRAINDRELHGLLPSVTPRYDDVDRARMLRNGWCPSEIYAQDRSALDISSIWFTQYARRNTLNQSHEDCDASVCQRLQIDLKNYITRHVNESCDCAFLEPDKADVFACLDDGTFPVLEVVGDSIESVTVNVHSAQSLDEDESWVAISHVWADGLGHSQHNSLPRCQILRLHSLVQNIKAHTFTRGSVSKQEVIKHKKRLFLWCDTLCCPIETEYKHKDCEDKINYKAISLGQMNAVYKEAAWVLVLDRDIQCYNYDEIGSLEAGFRIIFSRWMTRLWTFQEASLPLRLLIQFGDKPISIFPLMNELSRLFHATHPRTPFYMMLVAYIVMLRNMFHSDTPGWISDVASAVAYRAVSHSSDEPICIGNALGLDCKQISDADIDKRMSVVWQLLCRTDRGVKKLVIFNTLSRMQEPGFRWAPASFLQSYTRQLDYISIERFDGNPAVLLKHGLRVSCAGWRVRLAKRPACIPEKFAAVFHVMHVYLPAMLLDGTCYNIYGFMANGIPGPQNSLLQTLADESKEWYIILHKQARFDHVPYISQQKALLVSKEISEYGSVYYRTHKLMNVDRVAASTELSRRVQHIYAKALWRSWSLKTVQLLTSVLDVLDYTLNWPATTSALPGIEHQHSIEAYLQPSISWTHRQRPSIFIKAYSMLFTRLMKSIELTPTHAIREPAAAKLWRETDESARPTIVGGDILAAFMGRFVEVTEVYDESTDWVVD